MMDSICVLMDFGANLSGFQGSMTVIWRILVHHSLLKFLVDFWYILIAKIFGSKVSYQLSYQPINLHQSSLISSFVSSFSSRLFISLICFLSLLCSSEAHAGLPTCINWNIHQVELDRCWCFFFAPSGCVIGPIDDVPSRYDIKEQ